VQDEKQIAPEAYTLDSALLARPGNDEIQLDLFLDYARNEALYPKFQDYFRTKKPSLLAVWGKNDPFFLFAEPRLSRATIPMLMFTLLMLGISRLRPIIAKSAMRSGSF
jgi:hypothetical protein